MKNKFVGFSSVAMFLWMAAYAHADLAATSWQIGAGFFKLGVNGTLSGPTPPVNRNFLFIASAHPFDDYVSWIGTYFANPTTTLTRFRDGAMTTSVSFESQSFVGTPDDIAIYFPSDLLVGDQIGGELTVSVQSNVLNLQNFSSPTLYWGRASIPGVASSGTFQAVITPEPETSALALTALLICSSRQFRTRPTTSPQLR